MPRQTFLSKESFVESSETRTREIISLLSEHASNISFVTDNKHTGLMRFCYVSRLKKEYHIDISVLPLNNQYTRVCLHASQINEEAFYENADLAMALHEVETGIIAMVNGDFSYFRQKNTDVVATKSFTMQPIRSFFDVFFLRKKLS